MIIEHPRDPWGGPMGSLGGTLGIPRGNPEIPRMDPIGSPWDPRGALGPLGPRGPGEEKTMKKYFVTVSAQAEAKKHKKIV